MMPTFSCTEITSYSGNTQIYIVRKKEEKRGSAYKVYPKQQKILGIVLIVISIVGFLALPEDNGAFVVSGLMGIARIIYK